MGWAAFLDACVLEEVRRNLAADQRCTGEKADSLMAIMNDAFPEASVEGYEGLIPAMTNHASDRHILAAAVVAKADVIVTDNMRHFPMAACEPYGLEVQTADEFLSFSFDLAPGAMGAAFLQQVADWSRPTLDASAALSRLDARLPSFADRLRTLPDVRSAAGLR